MALFQKAKFNIFSYFLVFQEVVEDVNYTPDNKLMQNINCFVPPEVLVGHNQWSEKCDVWCLAALLLEFNLENYMWDNQTIEKSKSNYINKVSVGSIQKLDVWF